MKLSVSLLKWTLLASLAAVPAFAAPFGGRDEGRQDRVAQGPREGQFGPREERRLERGEGRFERRDEREWRGGRRSFGERGREYRHGCERHGRFDRR